MSLTDLTGGLSMLDGVVQLTSNDHSVTLNPASGTGIVDLSVSSGGGTVSSVSNADGSITVSPTTGSVVISNNTGWKRSVYAVATANIPATYNNGASGAGATLTVTATGVLTIDGVTASLGRDFLLRGQSTQAQNGIYVVTTAGAVGISCVLTRRADYNSISNIAFGDDVHVTLGNTNPGSLWYQNLAIVTIGTSAISFISTVNTNSLTVNGNSIIHGSLTIDNQLNVGVINSSTINALAAFTSFGNASLNGFITSTGLFTSDLTLNGDILTAGDTLNFSHVQEALSVGKNDKTHNASIEGVAKTAQVIVPPTFSASLVQIPDITPETTATATQHSPLLGNPSGMTLTQVLSASGFYIENASNYTGRIWSYDGVKYSAFPSAANGFTDSGGVAPGTSGSSSEDVTGSGYIEGNSTYDYQLFPYFDYDAVRAVSASPFTIPTLTDGGAVITPATCSSTENTAETGYTEPLVTPDVYDFLFYTYAVVNSIRYITAAPQTTSVTTGILGLPFGIDMTSGTTGIGRWDGTIVVRQINGSGYNDGIDLGTAPTFVDDNSLWDIALNQAAVTAPGFDIPFSVALSSLAAGTGRADGWYLCRQINGSGYNDGQNIGNNATFSDVSSGWDPSITPTTLAMSPFVSTVNFNLQWLWSFPIVTQLSPADYLLDLLINSNPREYLFDNSFNYVDSTGVYGGSAPGVFYPDYLANNTTRTYNPYAYDLDPLGTAYYQSASSTSYMMTDDNSGNLYSVLHSFGRPLDRIIGNPDGTSTDEHFNATSAGFTEYSDSWTAGNTVTPIFSDVGYLSDGTKLNIDYNAYNTTPNPAGGYAYSTNVLSSVTDPNDGNYYGIVFTISGQTTPYKVLRDNGLTLTGALINAMADLAYESWADSTVVTPTGYFLAGLWGEAGDASAIAMVLKTFASQIANAADFQDSTGAVVAGFSNKYAFIMAQMADADAPNGSEYYSNDSSKPGFKDYSGTFNPYY